MATKKRGRPATGVNPAVGVRLPRHLLNELDRWRLSQDIFLNRPEAVRQLIREMLRISSQDETINNVATASEPAPNLTINALQGVSRAQCRAARALLEWSQEDLARASGITKKTIADFERGATTPRRQSLKQFVVALEAAGIEFLDGGRPGVRLRGKP